MTNNQTKLPKSLKTASYFLMGYGFIVFLNAILYLNTAESSDIIRALIRILGIIITIIALYQLKKWGWWLGILYSGILSILSILSLYNILFGNILNNSPYPTIDKVFFILITLFNILAFIYLMKPQTKMAFKKIDTKIN